MLNTDLFYFFNHSLQNSVFDIVMPSVTGAGGFISLFVFLIILILFARFKNKKTLKKIAVLALIALLFSDLIVFCLKHLINEPRPFVTFNNVNLLIHEQDPYSFPSGHSASTLSVVTFLILNMKKLAKKHYMLVDVLLVLFAILIPFSRLYVGVHYPSDVFAGGVIGIFGALMVNRFSDEIVSFLKL